MNISSKMVGTCCVYGCTSESYKGSDLSFHVLPKNEERRKLWLENMEIRRKISKNTVVCSKHFEPSCFVMVNFRQCLKADAVPTISAKGFKTGPNENQMIVDVYNHLQETWPAKQRIHTRMCEKTAEVLATNPAKVCRVLKRKGINVTKEPQRPITPIEVKECETDNSDKSNSEQESPAKTKRAHKTYDLRQGKDTQTPQPKIAVKRNLTKSEVTLAKVGVECLKNINTSLERVTKNGNGEMLEHYECPLCKILYPSSEKAIEHLKYYHSREGINPECIKKVSVRHCPVCKKKVKSLLMHQCEKEKLFFESSSFNCSICKKKLPTIRMFDDHVIKTHSHETSYFPSFNDFVSWKQYIENESGILYKVVEERDNKKYYRCECADRLKLKLCPGLMIAQEFGNGIHVVLFETHELIKKKYTLPAKYKKYSISKLVKPVEGYNATKVIMDDNDQYLQLKTLLENIAVDAAKINIAGLRLLMSKALEMASILTSYDEETEENVEKQFNLSDAQIANALQDKDDVTKAKRPKLDTMSPKILNTFSLASIQINNNSDTASEDELTDIDLEILKSNMERKTVDTDILKDCSDQTDTSKVTFNDTYKDFVTKNFVQSDKPIKCQPKRRPVVKTKIGQFNPVKIAPNPEEKNDVKTTTISEKSLKTNQVVKNDEIVSPKINQLIKNVEKVSPKINQLVKNDVKVSPKINQLVKNDVKVSPKINQLVKNDVKVSPKINQLVKNDVKVSPKINQLVKNIEKVSPKIKQVVKNDETMAKTSDKNSDSDKIENKVVPKSVTRVSSVSSRKVDFEYEVIEQEEDCNILVLKL
ncbi:uncharacterized protein LOC123704703 [Colias croceus]|uniref:uncharacterized protein LOC123704703 n=1 Tax=Colias crocea TaxID=72248 RepID=UPI001E27E3E4|nr:uncharacterized protein LOC123704703 [Colias croceus]